MVLHKFDMLEYDLRLKVLIVQQQVKPFDIIKSMTKSNVHIFSLMILEIELKSA